MQGKALEIIVGSKNILDRQEVLEEYSGDMSFVPRVRPGCVVKPGNAAEVQALIKWANEMLTPVIPVSSGPPHFRGDTVPSAGGAVIADLSRMKEVIRVDRRNRVTMVEPGVTFGELIPRLAQDGLRLNLPLLPRGNKSVIGSMLEREPVIMPLYQWDATDPLTCIEVIFGTGDQFRTGSAAGPGTLEKQWKAGQAQVNPMGPGQTDFARVVQGAQGTMGVVTWSTIRCELAPTVQSPFLVGSDSIETLSDFIYRLMWLKAGDECLVLNRTDMAALLAKESKEYKAIKDALPPWLLFFCLSGFEYFPEKRVAYQEEQVLESAQRFGVSPLRAISGVSAYELIRILGKPSEEPFWKLRHKGGCGDIFFITTLDRVSKFVGVMYEMAERYNYATSDIGIYVQPMVQGTSCHCEFSLFYDPADGAEVSRVRDLNRHAGEALMDAGAFFSRPYGTWSDMAYRRDGETTLALRKVKQIFDPKNIMNPGKLCF